MGVIYVIDPTSRQHGFRLDEGVEVEYLGTKYNITEDNLRLDIFNTALNCQDTFIMYGSKNITVFNGAQVTGVQYSKEC